MTMVPIGGGCVLTLGGRLLTTHPCHLDTSGTESGRSGGHDIKRNATASSAMNADLRTALHAGCRGFESIIAHWQIPRREFAQIYETGVSIG